MPDGDTGTNLTLTARGIVEALDATEAAGRPELAHAVTRAALMSARGNSGVILSQIVRGAAEALGEATEVDAAAVAKALRGASDAAYRAVRKPVEGTMLTVVRETADAAERLAAESPSCSDLLRGLVDAAEESRPAHARAARRCCASRASSTPAAPASPRSSAASPPS